MLISKADIKYYANFTLNVVDHIINPSMLDAQNYDLQPIIGDDMYYKLLADFDGSIITVWNNTDTYVPLDYVTYKRVTYKCINPNTNSQPDINPGNWVVNELGTFYYNYLIPYLVFKCYGRFLLWAGRNITQYGLRENNEDTSAPVSDVARAALISDINVKGNIWYNRFKNRLCKLNDTFDGVKYTVDCNVYNANPIHTYKIRSIK